MVSANDALKKREKFHIEALTRSSALCGFSKDAQFCPRPKVFPYPEKVPLTEMGNEVICFCQDHQAKPRFAISRFNDEEQAALYDAVMRAHGYASAIWQRLHVIVGPTDVPTATICPSWRNGFEDYQEWFMYEDALMYMIQTHDIDLTHIVGRKDAKYGY